MMNINSGLVLGLILVSCPLYAAVHSELANSDKISQSAGKVHPPIHYDTIWADKQGATHVAHCQMQGLEFKSYAPPASPQWIGLAPDQIERIAFGILPPGYVAHWHHAPGPQWVITLSGRWAVQTTDGSVLEQGPGQLEFNADNTSFARPNDARIGHTTRTVGNEPNIQMIIKLKPGAVNAQAQGPCAF